MVQEAALTALASIADNAQTAFAKYYATRAPVSEADLSRRRGKEHRMLRAKAVECISLVGMAVGKERFAPDAKEVMDMLMQLQAGGFEDDDARRRTCSRRGRGCASASGRTSSVPRRWSCRRCSSPRSSSRTCR